MLQRYVIGIDISKSKIDCAVLSSELEVALEKEVLNTEIKIQTFISDTAKSLKISMSDVLICCENTGVYNRPLERACKKMGVDLWVEHPVKIKRASIDMRGKSDRKDALRIAEYAIRYNDRKVLFTEASKPVRVLNEQTKIRKTLLQQKVGMENQLKEAKNHDMESYKILEKGFSKVIKTINKSIQEVDKRIDELVKENENIQRNADLITTIPGIGRQNAINFIIATNNFSGFNSAKHLACYAGVVPFENQSGTIMKRARVSKMANKNLKRLLHLAAMAAIRFDPELQAYYIRKVQEGKNKMSVLNAVRNKLVHRIMAVVRKGKPYEVKNPVSIKKETVSLAY
jgi:transposase